MSSPNAHGGERPPTAMLATDEILQPQEAHREARHSLNTSKDPFSTPLTESSVLHSTTNTSPASYHQVQPLASHIQYTPGSQHVSKCPSMPHPLIKHNASPLRTTAAPVLSGPASSSHRHSPSATVFHHQPRHLRFQTFGIDTQATDDDAHMSVSETALGGGELDRISSRASSFGSTVKRQKTRDERSSSAASNRGGSISEHNAVLGAGVRLKQRATKVSTLQVNSSKELC